MCVSFFETDEILKKCQALLMFFQVMVGVAAHSLKRHFSTRQAASSLEEAEAKREKREEEASKASPNIQAMSWRLPAYSLDIQSFGGKCKQGWS